MSPEVVAQRQHELKASIDANKIPAVRLSEMQIAKIKEVSDDQIVWYSAGLQSDGKTFVCFVTKAEDRVGGQIQLRTAVFATDGSFYSTPSFLVRMHIVLANCRKRGIEPPVKLCSTSLTGEYCDLKPS